MTTANALEVTICPVDYSHTQFITLSVCAVCGAKAETAHLHAELLGTLYDITRQAGALDGRLEGTFDIAALRRELSNALALVDRIA